MDSEEMEAWGMSNNDMSWDDAILKLTITQMDFGMLMPKEWVENNGPGSEYFKAVRKAIYAMERMKEIEPE